jgi:hypothetical protein
VDRPAGDRLRALRERRLEPEVRVVGDLRAGQPRAGRLVEDLLRPLAPVVAPLDDVVRAGDDVGDLVRRDAPHLHAAGRGAVNSVRKTLPSSSTSRSRAACASLENRTAWLPSSSMSAWIRSWTFSSRAVIVTPWPHT